MNNLQNIIHYSTLNINKFFKIKINELYLHSTISLKILSNLIILLIKKYLLEYKNLINDFTS